MVHAQTNKWLHTRTYIQVSQESIQKYSKCAKPLRASHYFATNGKLVVKKKEVVGVERINQKRLKDIQLEKRGNGKMKGTRRGGEGRAEWWGETKDKIRLALFILSPTPCCCCYLTV